jgi:hypothetical protein
VASRRQVDVLKLRREEAIVADRLPPNEGALRQMPSKGNTATSPLPSEEVRCHCGQLIARIVEEGLELKCKRCRRILVIPLSAIGGRPFHTN